MSKFLRYEADIIDALAALLDCTVSDAQALVALNSFYVNQGWAGGKIPEWVAAKIDIDTSNKKARAGS